MNKYTIVVVSSDQDVEEMLKNEGYAVVKAEASNVTTLAMDTCAGAVVVRHEPPMLNSLDIIAKLKANEPTRGVPVLLLLPPGPDVTEKARLAGASAVIHCPFEAESLITAVISLLVFDPEA